MKKVGITETILRDGQQSLIATRMKTDTMLPILETMDEIGYHAMEVWGGATYDVCIRYLNEDPWERLRTIRKHVKKTKLQMLLRGQNLLGYRHYADDVVDGFVDAAASNGIDIIRVFDALNDTRNVERAINACNKSGVHAQGCISFTLSPVHTNETFVNLAKELEEMGSKSICIKDMAGLLGPHTAYELVSAIKSKVSIPLELHTHATSGFGSMTYLKAIEAGCDIVDTALSPFAEGTSQPPTEPIAEALLFTDYDPQLNTEAMTAASEYFKPIREACIQSGLLNIKALGVDIRTLHYQVPGGMISNLLSQLKDANALHRLDEVLQEIPRVREDFGYPPLVTPSSQIVGTQAVMNVLAGERYKLCPKESKDLVRGMYGRTTIPIKEEIIQKVAGDLPRVTGRPADQLKPEMKKLRKKVKPYAIQPEDVFTEALFPQLAGEFFQMRDEEMVHSF